MRRDSMGFCQRLIAVHISDELYVVASAFAASFNGVKSNFAQFNCIVSV